MCGIVGVSHYGSGTAVEKDLLKRMNDLQVHRGPDDEGYYAKGPVGMAMRRLSIIDLSTGKQPISNETGDVWVVLNGEIYNFQSLREDLLGKGHTFRTKTDTEAIVHLYEEYGVDCVKKLRGMFAFSLYDEKKDLLLIARDRIGKKPLNYTLHDGRLAWASEIRSLLVLPGLPTEINPLAIDCYLSLQYIPSPLTIYKSIRKLPPAHTLVLEKGKVTLSKYWDLPLGDPLKMSYEEAKGELLDKLEEATRIRMISDVPLGAFLSGGIDSSAVVAMMSRASETPVKTFAIGFDEAEFSELEYAKALAEHYGTDHSEFIVKADMAETLPKIAWHYGEPYADPSALPSYYVARETRRAVTVALNGDGGDESFAGYIRYNAMKAAAMLDYVPGPLLKAFQAGFELLPERDAPKDLVWRGKRFLRSAVFADLPTRHLKMIGFFQEDEKDALFSDEMKSRIADYRRDPASDEYSAGLDPRLGPLSYMRNAFDLAKTERGTNKILYVDYRTYLAENLMAKMDIATMANSLEGRSPLLDHELVEFVFRMPSHWKLKGIRGSKHILKDALAPLLPEKIKKRNKMGFGIPLGPWFRGELKEFWREHVMSDRALSRGYFKPEALKAIFDEHLSGKRDHGYRMWALLMLELWHEAYKR